jgi:hypothetical protein
MAKRQKRAPLKPPKSGTAMDLIKASLRSSVMAMAGEPKDDYDEKYGAALGASMRKGMNESRQKRIHAAINTHMDNAYKQGVKDGKAANGKKESRKTRREDRATA